MDVSDVEGESVLTSIFKDAFQDSYEDNPEFIQYLSELSSYGINRLNSEPYRLAEEKAQILEETRSLAFHNYKTFIQTADCCKEIFQDFQVIEKHVESVLQKLPNLTTCCKSFLKEAQDINASRKTNNLTLLKYPQLLELLELPQLVDTCVRNEYYEETLELAEYVKRLEKKHSSIPIVQKIVEEVKVNMQLMLMQLFQQLRSNVQLPACLRVLSYLRRMNIFTETELRIKFLQTRDAWFQSVLQSIPREEPYHHISKTIEMSRVHLFDIITQYRAIFSDDEMTFMNAKDQRVNDAALFHSWVLQKISQFLSTLEEDLSRGVGSRLESIFGQCMYFGLSFSRVGADFRALVVPIFHRIILRSFTSAVANAGKKLNEILQSYTLLGSQTSLPSGIQMTIQTGSSLQPPMNLLEFPPLAAYCNNLLSALDDLRICAPFTLVCDVTECITASLVRAVELIEAFHRLDETTFNEQESEKFGILCRCFAEDLVPHINRCLQSLFQPQHLSALIGAPVADHDKAANLGGLDQDKIVEPLMKFILQQSAHEESLLPLNPAEAQEPSNRLEETGTKESDEQTDKGLEEIKFQEGIPVEAEEEEEEEEETGEAAIPGEGTSILDGPISEEKAKFEVAQLGDENEEGPTTQEVECTESIDVEECDA